MNLIEEELAFIQSIGNRNKVEILGLAEQKNEIVTDLVLALARAAKVDIDQSDRIGTQRKKTPNNRHGIIEVEFKNVLDRDSFMKETKKK